MKCEHCGKPVEDSEAVGVYNARRQLFFIGHADCAKSARRILRNIEAAKGPSFRTVDAAKKYLKTRRVAAIAAMLMVTVALVHSPQARAWGYHERDSYSAPAPARDALPDPAITPGAFNPAVTQATLDSTVCIPGYSRSIRPPERYTERLKREQIREDGYADTRIWHYEEDHLVPLSIGGSPTSPQNLWPQPHNVEGGWGSYAKDHLEYYLWKAVCARRISLAAARRIFTTNWVAGYQRYLGPTPDNRPLSMHHSGHRFRW